MRSRSILIAGAILTVAVIAVVWTVLSPSSTSSSASSGLTLDRLATYTKSVGACHGTFKSASGATLTATAKTDHIIADFYCQNGHVLTIVDVFASNADRAAMTSQKNFLSEPYCAAHQNNCAVDFEKNWIYLGVASTKDKGTQLATDQSELKADAQSMTPANIDAKA